MTREDFIKKVGVNVSEEDYEAINKVYTSSDVNTELFCELWKAMNWYKVKVANSQLQENLTTKPLSYGYN